MSFTERQRWAARYREESRYPVATRQGQSTGRQKKKNPKNREEVGDKLALRSREEELRYRRRQVQHMRTGNLLAAGEAAWQEESTHLEQEGSSLKINQQINKIKSEPNTTQRASLSQKKNLEAVKIKTNMVYLQPLVHAGAETWPY